MKRVMLKSKIHRARVTDTNVDYEGSITIDEEIMRMVDILPYEKVAIYNISNGNRLETYAIQGKKGSKEFIINGAAARLMQKGDIIIVVAFAVSDEEEIKEFTPRIIRMDQTPVNIENRPPSSLPRFQVF
jgi:aspartate 1-decarboxylase